MKTNNSNPYYNEPPYPNNSPILLSFDFDLGWIVEQVNDGEYEVQNLPFPGEKNEEPDFDLAIDLAKKNEVRVRYIMKTSGQ